MYRFRLQKTETHGIILIILSKIMKIPQGKIKALKMAALHIFSHGIECTLNLFKQETFIRNLFWHSQ